MDISRIRRRLRNRRTFGIALFAVVLLVFGSIGIGAAFEGGSWKRIEWGPGKHQKRVVKGTRGLTTTTTSPTTTGSSTSSTSTTTRSTTAVTPSGQFTDGFANLDNWTFAHWRSEIPGNADTASTATIVNGQAQIAAADQNYGDATLRSNTKYRLGEIRLTLSDNSQGWPLLGSAFVGLTTDPYNAPSIKRDNGDGPTPANGVLIHLRDNCRVSWGGPQVSTYVNHAETVTTASCLGAQPTGPTELRVTNGHVEFWSAAGKYAEVDVAVPATGYLILGVHNHASQKYTDGPGPMPAVIGLFDNITYPSAGSTVSYRNGAGVTNVGTSARVVFNAYGQTTPVNAAVVVNGHSHPFTPYYPASRSVAASVAVPVSDLVVGNNTITIVGGLAPVANVDLVIEGSGGSPTANIATSTTTTRPATSTTTTRPPTTSTGTSTTTTSPATSTPAPSAAAFSESFATDQRSRFDFQLHTSANGGPTKIADEFVGEHNLACQGPDTQRVVHGGMAAGTFLDVSASELSWWCAPSGDPAKGHFMTALDTDDIATLSFTPKQTFNDVTQVCWDQNMNNLGEAKWVNVFVVPAGDIAAHGGDFSYAASSGLAFGGIDRMPPAGSFDFTWLRGSTYANKWGPNATHTETMSFWASTFGQGMVPEGPLASAPRFKICLTSGGNMVIQRPNGTTDTRAIGTTFPSGAVKVIFQDASYNPTKHEGSVDRLSWHWDNIVVSTSASTATANLATNIVPVSFAPSGHDPLQAYCAI